MKIIALIVWLFALAAQAATEQQINQLITQLGDSDFKKREAATTELKAIGKEAVPALKAAEKSEDPEVRGRVADILNAINPPPATATTPAMPQRAAIRLGGGGVRGQIMVMQGGVVQVGGGQAQMEAVNKSAFDKDGKKYEVTRTTKNGVSKIEVRIKEPGKDGKEIERVVEADSDEDLAKKDAELAKLVKAHAAKAQGNAVQIQMGGQVIVNDGQQTDTGLEKP